MPANDARIAGAFKLLEPWRRLTSPVYVGMENIPSSRPLLFVGNHTIFGMLDSPLLVAEVYRRHGFLLRGLGDHAHFQVPVWRDFLTQFGVVDGTRENCDRLMREGEAVLVFPGGAREVAKRRGEKYRLMWKERLGFARLAIRHRCAIVPFAAVGAEDAYDIVIDGNDVMASPLGKLLALFQVRPEAIMPLARGLGPTPLPRPERFYFSFAPPVATDSYQGREDDEAACRHLRDRVRGAVEAGIASLIEKRAADPERSLLGRVTRRLRRR